MIPQAYITQWQQYAPWPDNNMIEQDLVISRALIDLFQEPELRDSLAFRGGTALFKLYLPAARYSEDIDLVQIKPGPMGHLMDKVRSALSPLSPAIRPAEGNSQDRIFMLFDHGVSPLRG